ncbi:MAG: SDR family NAD(P)-dependent oxidoreductase [Eubacteriales bacterium]
MLQIDLRGKTAIVTGAAGQLGRTISRTLADCGANVIVHYHSSREAAEKLSGEIAAKYGVRSMAFSADVGEIDSVIAMRDRIRAEFVMPDIVVAAAVAQYEWKSILEQDISDYESQFRTCVLHNVNMAKAFVPHMIEQNYGKYVGINSECAMRCGVNESAYDSAKRGMDGVLRVLAKEVGRYNITVNQVAPGWTISDRDRENHTEIAPDYSAGVPLRRRGTDYEIASAVAFLSSDLSGFISGVYLPVCGGAEMPCI